MIFKAIKDKELTARKDGRATLIEMDELTRWVRSLPTIGRNCRGAGRGGNLMLPNTVIKGKGWCSAKNAGPRWCANPAEKGFEIWNIYRGAPAGASLIIALQ